ncbi:8-oxo-dGTP diphosphatase [Rhodosporidiobolus nylandii]
MMLVTPIVCFVLDYSLKPEINPSEVSDLFSFPLEGLLASEAGPPVFNAPPSPAVARGEKPYHMFEDYPWFDGRPHRFHSFEARPQAVTGLTAEILIHVASIAYGRPPSFPLYAPLEMPGDELIRRAMQDPKWHEFRRKWSEKRLGKEEIRKAKM